MPLTSTPFDTVPNTPMGGVSLRKACAVGAVVLIHGLFFYGFTHRGEMVKIMAPVSTVLVNIQDIKPSPPPPQPVKPKEAKLEQTPIETPLPEIPPVEPEVAPPMETSEAISTAPISDAPPMVSLDTIHIVRKSEPVYPAAERRAGHEGRVVLKLFIDSEGKATAVEVAQSSGYSALDEAALSAVKHWRFGGNKTGGVVSVLLPISFKLN